MTRKRAIVFGLLIVLAIWAFVFKASSRMPDFEVYWKAAGRAAAAEPLYRAEDGHYQFKYLPAFAVLAIPLGFATLPVAEMLWFFVSVALLVALVAVNVRLPHERRKSAGVLVAVLIVVFGKFYAHELVLGQVNILFVLVVSCALLAMKASREPLAGGLVACAIVIKPYAVLLLPWLAARRRPAATIAAGAGLAAALLLPAAVYGFDGNVALHREWWRTVAETTSPNLSNPDNVSLASMFFRWIGPGPLSARLAIVTAAALLGVATLTFLGRRGVSFPEGLEGGMLLTLMPLLSPQGWDYVFLVATPAIAILANYEDRLPRLLRAVTIVAAATIGLSLFDLMGRRAYYAFMRMSIISLCFFVVVAALAALRRRKVA